MAFDTFDEGIAPGGLRSKNEIKILICYLYNSVNDKMSKELIVEAISEYELANFFEISAAFDELVKGGKLAEAGKTDGEKAYLITKDGRIIADQLDTSLSYSVKEKSYECAVKLLSQRKTARENLVEITKTSNEFFVNCRVLDGELELFSFKLFAPDLEQAELIKKNFLSYPSNVYKTMLSLVTKDRAAALELLEQAFDEI